MDDPSGDGGRAGLSRFGSAARAAVIVDIYDAAGVIGAMGDSADRPGRCRFIHPEPRLVPTVAAPRCQRRPPFFADPVVLPARELDRFVSAALAAFFAAPFAALFTVPPAPPFVFPATLPLRAALAPFEADGLAARPPVFAEPRAFG